MSNINQKLYDSRLLKYKEDINRELLKIFSKNLKQELLVRISNLIAIDYFYRLNEVPILSQHLPRVVTNLKNHIGNQSYEKNDFSFAMTLFVVAITDEVSNDMDDDQILLESDQVVIGTLIKTYYPDISPDLRTKIFHFLKELMNELGPREMVKFVSNNPLYLKERIKNANIEQGHGKIKSHELTLELKQHKNIQNQVSKNSQAALPSRFKQALSVAALATIPIALGFGSIMLSFAFIVPGIALPYLNSKNKAQHQQQKQDNMLSIAQERPIEPGEKSTKKRISKNIKMESKKYAIKNLKTKAIESNKVIKKSTKSKSISKYY